jgi:hypothetical protein
VTDVATPSRPLIDQLEELGRRRAELVKQPVSPTTICELSLVDAELDRVHEDIRKAGPEAFRAQVLARIAARQGVSP